MDDLYEGSIPKFYCTILPFDEFILDIRKYISNEYFTLAPLKENGFNPLIIKNYKEIRSLLADILLKKKKVKTEMAKHISEKNNKDLLILKYDINRQINELQEYICFLHDEWRDCLPNIRKNIQKNDLIELVRNIETLYNSLKNCDIPFKDFLEFKGIFHNCKWYWKKPPKKPPKKPHRDALTDVITIGHYALDRRGQWAEFYPDLTPQKILYNIFGDFRVRYKTWEDPMLQYLTNPLAQILRDEIVSHTFIDAIRLLNHDKDCLHLEKTHKLHNSEDRNIFKPQLYGKAQSITDLMKYCDAAETTLRRFIKSENNKELGYPINSPKRGVFYIKNGYTNKIKDLFKNSSATFSQ